MRYTRPALAFGASLLICLFAGLPASAADLTIARPVAGEQRKPANANTSKPKRAKKTIHPSGPAKTKRRRIISYRLNDDLNLNPHATQIGYNGVLRRTPAWPQSASRPVPAMNQHAGSPGGNGLSDCERHFNAGSPQGQLSACFEHQLDKSWKAQTFVSRQKSGGSGGGSGWGGGLAVGYVY